MITAHGREHSNQNDSWIQEAAQYFMLGSGASGDPPTTWLTRAVSTTSSASFYDSLVVLGGSDTDAASGIDRAMLLFYVGHGGPDAWDTLTAGDQASPAQMLVGNCANTGTLRYAWFCSCQVLAHGPQTCPQPGNSTICPAGNTSSRDYDYAWPGFWNGEADGASIALAGGGTATVRNVFQRWGPALGQGLRMICGASTNATCQSYDSTAMWWRYNGQQYAVADSFMAVQYSHGHAPVCLALGGERVQETPLVTDARFTTAANTAGTSHYHIQYAEPFGGTYAPVRFTQPGQGPPPLMPVLAAAFSRPVEEHREQDMQLESPPLDDAEYIDLAEHYRDKLQEQLDSPPGGAESFGPPSGMRFMLASTSVNWQETGQGVSYRLQKNVVVSWPRQLDPAAFRELPGLPGMLKSQGLGIDELLASLPEQIDLLGGTGQVEVQMNNDGSLLNAWIDSLQVGEALYTADVKPYEVALAEAWQEMGLEPGSGAYQEPRWRWGYGPRVNSASPTGRALEVFYQFRFEPQEDSYAFPPREIYIPAQGG